jgi:hypothetical protein
VRGPLDSKSFNAQLQQLGIQLELKERKNL